jgi:sugar lactone lactonase YvrE
MKTKLVHRVLFGCTCLFVPGMLHSQNISTVAGNGTAAYGGDGGPATSASMMLPAGVAVNASGTFFIADFGDNRVRKVSGGIISTYAGNGTAGYSGDGGAATSATLHGLRGLAVDAAGNLYIADALNNCIRKVNTSGTITTIAGNGTAGFSGDGGSATLAMLNIPTGMVADASGNIFIADAYNNRIRKVSSSGIITTVAGNGTGGFTGDGSAATAAELNGPSDVAVDAAGNLYIADSGNNRIRMVNSSGTITTIAGDGNVGYAGDGGLALTAELSAPTGLCFDPSGNLYVADANNNVIRAINTSGHISTFAGNGSQGYTGDGGPATSASFNLPYSVATDAGGNVFIADYSNQVVREVVAVTGIVSHSQSHAAARLFPNPGNGNLQVISTEKIDLLIVSDILGKVILETRPETENLNLRLEHSGIYFVTLKSGNHTETQRVLVN